MLYETLNQPIICLLLILIGFLSGFVYDISNYIVFLCKNNSVVKIIFDFLATICIFSIFYVSILNLDYGRLRLYHFLIFFIFLILERISLGKLIAKLIDICYNLLTKMFNKIGGLNIWQKKKTDS